MNAISLGEHHPRQGDGRMAVGVTGEGVNLRNRRLAEDAHGEGRTVAADAATGEHSEPVHALVVNHGKQRNVVAPLPQPVEQFRRHIQRQVNVGRIFEPVNQRLGVKEADAAEAKGPA